MHKCSAADRTCVGVRSEGDFLAVKVHTKKKIRADKMRVEDGPN